MTEYEAIEILKEIVDEIVEDRICYATDCDKEPLEMAIQAIEKQSMVNEILNELKHYRAIGTVEELQALKEKSVAKKALNCYEKYPNNHGNYSSRDRWCPTCGSYIIDNDANPRINERIKQIGYCYCGQHLDWE